MVRISDKWALDADTRCWILRRRVVSKTTGKESWRPTYFFPTIDSVVGWWAENGCREAIKGIGMTGLQEIQTLVSVSKADMAECLRIVGLQGKDWHKAMAKKLK